MNQTAYPQEQHLCKRRGNQYTNTVIIGLVIKIKSASMRLLLWLRVITVSTPTRQNIALRDALTDYAAPLFHSNYGPTLPGFMNNIVLRFRIREVMAHSSFAGE